MCKNEFKNITIILHLIKCIDKPNQNRYNIIKIKKREEKRMEKITRTIKNAKTLGAVHTHTHTHE